ncbi:MAG: alpha/beta hydrolase [Chlorobium sp.]|nr:MAG: alpha/beta hydrolase [Chlorobium sp.]
MQLEIITRKPEGNARPTPILFVHGMCHSASCWENFLPYFARQGYESHAVSLRGHGKSEGSGKVKWCSASRDYVADLEQVISSLNISPVLIGHSMGGYVVQKYLEKHDAPAAVLLASIPVNGTGRFAVRFLSRHPVQFVRYLLFFDPGQFLATPQLLKELVFSPSVTDTDIARYFERLQHESYVMTIETFFASLPKPRKVNAPFYVLAAANDAMFSVDEEQETARAYNTAAEIVPGMAHGMMLEPEWQKAADLIIAWLTEKGL